MTMTNSGLKGLNFNTLEFVPRYRDSNIQVGKKYSYLFSMGPIVISFHSVTVDLITVL